MTDERRIDSHKMDLHPRRVVQWLEAKDDWEKAKDVFPIYMEISPVGYCNHSCTFCGVDYMLDRPEKPKLSAEVMRRMLTDMAAHGVLSVMFAGAGEPMLYKPLAETIVHADRVGIDTSITTNAVLMSEEFCRTAFAASRLRWIRASVNGGTPEVYARLHRTKPEDFDRVLKNLERAVAIRGQMGAGVSIGAQLVALPETEGLHQRSLLKEQYPSNLATIVPLAKRLRDIGVDLLSIKPYSQHLMSEDTRVYQGVTYKAARHWAAEAQALSTKSFTVLVRYQTMAEWDADDRGYEKCHATPFHWAYVEADGEVWGCSAYLGRVEGDKTFGDDRFRYGNVNEQSFPDIWRGDRRKANWEYTRKTASEGGLDISECRKNCRMHQVNLYLERLTHPHPTASFI